MINFQNVSWTNLLSYGNTKTEVNLNDHKLSLIVGENGAGKSTILDAISYALYGKPFRGVNKPQLVNSINKKGLLVELNFSVGHKNYLIRRGTKPNLFEIYRDGELVDQDAAASDYQSLFEKQVLGLNHKSFSHIVVLGSANYIPFMMLKAAERRALIEDLLDIQVFSVMNNLLKERITTNRDALSSNDRAIEICRSELALHAKYLEEINQNKVDVVTSKVTKINEVELQIEAAKKEIADISAEVDKLTERAEKAQVLSERRAKYLDIEYKLVSKKTRLVDSIKFYDTNDNCPTCTQEITNKFKKDIINKKKSSQDEVDDALNKLSEMQDGLITELASYSDVNEAIRTRNISISELNARVTSWNDYIQTLRDEIESLAITEIHDAPDVDATKIRLNTLEEKRTELAGQRHTLEEAQQLLRDGGIKTKIIKQYIPVINKLINKYLAALDFFVSFEFNENFEESIKSRHRDDFSYSSFSEGEKMRIDLALLFTWRAVSKLKNSMSTNLLIMDEIMDSSLDASGSDEFLKLLHNITDDTNTFIISHKGDQLYDKFNNVIRFEKHKNFSRLVA